MRPRRRRLVLFHLSSETESLESHVDDGDGDDRDGASEAGPEVAMMEENAEDVTPLEVARPRPQVVRSALESLDEVDLRTLFSQRASLMKNIPRFLVGPYKNAVRVALAEVGRSAGNQVLLERGWKLFLLLPRMLLHRRPRGGLIAKSKLVERFEKFNRGEWVQLIRASVECDEQAVVSRRRKRRGGNDLEHRATRAFNLIQVGELSSARQALEGAEIAPGTEETLSKLTDTSKRPKGCVTPFHVK